ncbi:MAG: Flp family type IVb pilin [Candidatus Longimicrobiales bacterium M2_2A_002]
MTDMWNAFLQDESGQGLVEYVLIIAMVAIGLIAVLGLFRNDIGALFGRIAGDLGDAPGTAPTTYPAGTTP